MTLFDDIRQQPRLEPGPEGTSYDTHRGPPQRSERPPPGRFPGDRSDEQEERIRSTGGAGWWQLLATWLLAALLVATLLAVLAPDAPRPDLVIGPSTTSRPDDAARTPAAKDKAPVPCSDLDYAYEKC